METLCFSKMLKSTYETTQCQNPRQHQHYTNHHENLKSHGYEPLYSMKAGNFLICWVSQFSRNSQCYGVSYTYISQVSSFLLMFSSENCVWAFSVPLWMLHGVSSLSFLILLPKHYSVKSTNRDVWSGTQLFSLPGWGTGRGAAMM
jgi:hypothetical protein